MDALTKTLFGRTGLSVSPLGFGAAPIGYLKTDRDRAASILHLLLDAGVNLIDTAASYEGSEEVIGEAVGRRRGEFVLVSKCGTAVAGLPGAPWSAELVSATVDRALRRLKTDHLDVMLLHSCDLATLKQGEALGALADARDAGKIRFAGYSGDNDAAAYAAALPDVAVIETSVSIADQHNLDAVLPVARENNVGVLAKRPIANAAWRGVENLPGLYRQYAAPYADRLRQTGLRPSALGLPDDSNASWVELALRFTLGQSGVHAAIIGTTDPANARANLAVAAKGPLPAEVVRKVRTAFRTADPSGGWYGLT